MSTGMGAAATVADPPVSVRPMGRPRDVRLDVAIREATLQLLADAGYDALTMEAVAARAGVGKATLYRRYPGKEQLVVESVASLSEPPERTGAGSVRDELIAMLSAFANRSAHSLAGKIFPRLVAASIDHPELMARYREQVIRPRRERYAAVLRRGVADGVLRPDIDVEHAIDMLVGPLVYRSMHSTEPIPPHLSEQIVDDLFAGLAPRCATDEPRR